MVAPTLKVLHCSKTAWPHRMAYWEWGDASADHLVICVHGLTRQGRDFDVLAQALLARSAESGRSIRVVCPDVPGRGQSDWLPDPQAYQLAVYAADMLELIGHLKPATLDWVGTSMGGLIGIVVCNHAVSVGAPVRRLVLNDVGPQIAWSALVRIGSYVGKTMEFASFDIAAEAMWTVSRGFGPHSREQWEQLCRYMVKPSPVPGGTVVLHYDPKIAVALQSMTEESARQGETALWALYDAIEAKTLLLRGAQSDLLTTDTALLMQQRGPRAQLVEFEGVGHAPTLVAADQLACALDFLLQ
jgi:pimeloyl-ACP methyl ester carboxylesterase